MRTMDRVLVAMNFLLAACFAAAVLLFVEQLTVDRAWFSYVLRAAPILLAFLIAVPLGARAEKAARALGAPVCLLLAVAVWFLLRPAATVDWIFLAAAVALSVVLYVLGLRGG